MTEDATSDQPVLLERRGAVAVLTLNRPERMNGWTPALGELYFDLLADLSRDEQVRAIVVTGAGHFLQWERADVLNGALTWLCR